MENKTKYKVWSPRLNKMSKPQTIKRMFLYAYKQGVNHSKWLLPDKLVFLRFTGLFDSKVKDEYIGDIIEDINKVKREIVDGHSAILFINLNNNTDIKYFWELPAHYVIGNKYQNPELLK